MSFRVQRFFVFSILILGACSQTASQDSNDVVIGGHFDSYCDSFKSVTSHALKYHLTKDESDFDSLRRKTVEKLAENWGQTEIPSNTEDCSDILSLRPEGITEREAFLKATKLFMSGLDPHSLYLSPSEMETHLQQSENVFEGIGIEFRHSVIDRWLPPRPELAIFHVFKGSLAFDQLLDGEVVSLDGYPEQIKTQKELIQWSENFAPTLRLKRAEDDDFVELLAKAYKWSPVTSRRFDRDDQVFGYLRFRQFTKNSAQMAREALEAFDRDPEVQAILLDLRGNPGGLLTEAIELADIFMDQGLIARTTGNPNKAYPDDLNLDVEYRANEPGKITDKLILFLIDSDTASASEILAGALWNEVLILGDKSFGKGIGQIRIRSNASGYDLGGMVLLTMFRYEFADQFSPQARGISPHILMPHPSLYAMKEERKQLGQNVFLREEDFGDRTIPEKGPPGRSSPQGDIGRIIKRLRNHIQLPDRCKENEDCQLERAFLIGKQALREVDRTS